jgi:hypothetical protein
MIFSGLPVNSMTPMSCCRRITAFGQCDGIAVNLG